MKTFRIGNEIQVRWPILTNGEALSLRNRELTLYITDPHGRRREITNYGTEDNEIYFSFPANEQKVTGIYSLTLFEHIGTAGQTAVDCIDAFRLVAHSNEVPADMAPEELPLDATNVIAAIRGKSAYEIAVAYGYDGSEEEWAGQFNTVLTSLDVMAGYVQRSEEVAAQANELYEGLRFLNSSEQARVQAEQQRTAAEEQRAGAEQQREAAEQQRRRAFVDNELVRQQTFTQTENQRVQAFSENEALRQTTAENAEHSRSEAFKEAESQRSNTFETNESLRSTIINGTLASLRQNDQLRNEAMAAAIAAIEQTRSTQQTAMTVTVQPNILNVWTQPVTGLTLTLAPGAGGIRNEYMLEFTVTGGNFGMTVTNDDNFYWYEEPTWNAGWTYDVSIVNGLAVCVGFEA